MKLRIAFFGVFLFAALMLVPAAFADQYQTYNLAWSGASFSNSASATGQITIDLTTLPNPNSDGGNMGSSIQSLTVTVTGANSGNGTWTLSDLRTNNWWTGDVTLNMLTELVGQPTAGSSWGTPDSSSGDFNLFFNPRSGGPFGETYFTMVTNVGKGDAMLLTDFDPVTTATPEPGTMLLFGSGLAALAGMVRRKIGQRA
jgi:hypothetical protein